MKKPGNLININSILVFLRKDWDSRGGVGDNRVISKQILSLWNTGRGIIFY